MNGMGNYLATIRMTDYPVMISYPPPCHKWRG